MKIPLGPLAVLLATTLACGCSHTSAPSHGSDRLATTNSLAGLILDVDRIVVTNSLIAIDEYLGCTYSVPDREVPRIIRAVSSAEEHTPPVIETSCPMRLQFWKGTNHVLTLDFGGEVLRCGEWEYEDESGTMSTLSDRVHRKWARGKS